MSTILLVEDESIVAEDIRKRLHHMGYTVSAVVSSGEDAIQQAGERNPDLVLMDIILKGDMDGITAAESIRTRYNTPVVFVTACGDEEVLQRIENQKYVLKPFEDREIHAVIETALSQGSERAPQKWVDPDQIIEQLLQGIAVFDEEFNVLVRNKACAHIFGVPPDRPVSFEEMAARVHPDDKSAFVQQFQDCGAGTTVFRLMSKEVQWIEVVVNRITFCGRPAVQAVFYDITKNKNREDVLLKNQERLTNLIELIPDGIVAINLKGVVTFCNIPASTFTGYSRDEIVGYHISKLKFLRAQDIPRFLKSFTSIVRGTPLNLIQVDWHHKDGTLHSSEISARLLRENGKPKELLVVTRDITERKQAEEALKDNERKYRTLVEGSRDAIIINMRDGTFLDVNQSALDLFGYTRKEIMQLKAGDLYVDPADRKKFQHKVEQKESIRNFEVKLRKKDGTVMDCIISSTVWRSSKGTILGYEGIIRDMTERRKMEKALRESEEKFRSLFENTVIGIYRTTPDGCILMANPALVRMLGFDSFEELAQKNLEESGFEPEYPRSLFKERIETDGNVIGLESVWIRKDGTPLYIRENARAIRDHAGNTIYYEGTVEDITESKKAEEQIKQSLQEKEILLQEIHHRVKNNLQVISSLLNLQSAYVDDSQYREMFNESQNRIRSMALIHERLYQSENLADIDFRSYIKKLVRGLFRSYEVGADKVALAVDVGDVSLGVNAAIPCGLIINELVSNCLKHAFPDKKGSVKIILRSTNGDYQLVVKDNGIGIPEGIDFRNTETLGLRLVTILAESQLNGEIDLIRDKGTEFRITFKDG
jgi:PAS domain S-box-containing protein